MLKPVKRIICPVDVYDFQPETAEYAVTLAAALDAKIVVVYVMGPVPLHIIGEGKLLFTPNEEKALKQAAEAEMAKILSGYFGECADKGEVLLGQPADRIVQFAEECPADMIIMASHGRSALGRVIYGSVTTRVLANTSIPVLVIPPSKKEQGKH